MKPLPSICLCAALALVAWTPWALAEPAEDCRQMAAEESVPVEDLDDYIAECIAMLENEYPEEAEELLLEPMDPGAEESPDQE